jgi:hypothetical protein
MARHAFGKSNICLPRLNVPCLNLSKRRELLGISRGGVARPAGLPQSERMQGTEGMYTAAHQATADRAASGSDIQPAALSPRRSPDWTPWRALATLAERWPVLRFDLRPTYGGS